jgi:hypothetical protein
MDASILLGYIGQILVKFWSKTGHKLPGPLLLYFRLGNLNRTSTKLESPVMTDARRLESGDGERDWWRGARRKERRRMDGNSAREAQKCPGQSVSMLTALKLWTVWDVFCGCGGCCQPKSAQCCALVEMLASRHDDILNDLSELV